ncbi:MAG: nucleotide exchange factor GrpE [Acidobacteriota bacterium]
MNRKKIHPKTESDEKADSVHGSPVADEVAGAAEQEAEGLPGGDARQGATEREVAESPELEVTGDEQQQDLLDQLQGQIEHLQDQLLRRQAEMINYRRRIQQERAGLSKTAQAEVLRELLPVIDDFERAVDNQGQDAEVYHQGMMLILRGVEAALAKLGVEKLEPVGEAFDPRHHEAMARHETDEVPDGSIVEVFQSGYLLKDRLLRPAKVAVAVKPSGMDDADEAENSGRKEKAK